MTFCHIILLSQFRGMFIMGLGIFTKIREKALEKPKAQFKAELERHIKELENQTDYFEKNYKLIMETRNLNIKEIEKHITRIPTLKKELYDICNQLKKIGKENVCLNQKQLETLESSNSLTNERVSHDIIQALPIIGDYYRVYNLLHDTIYIDLFTNKIVMGVNVFAFGFVKMREADYGSKEAYEQARNAAVGYIEYCLKLDAHKIIKNMVKLKANEDIESTSNPLVKTLLSVADDDEIFHNLVLSNAGNWAKIRGNPA